MLLFTVYVALIGSVIKSFGITYHQFADYTKLFIAVDTADSADLTFLPTSASAFLITSFIIVLYCKRRKSALARKVTEVTVTNSLSGNETVRKVVIKMGRIDIAGACLRIIIKMLARASVDRNFSDQQLIKSLNC